MIYPAFVKEMSHYYNEPHRSYHSLTHIHTLFRHILTKSYEKHLLPGVKFDTFKGDGLTEFLMITAVAHDSYYDPYLGSPLNEYMSRLLFRETIKQVDAELIALTKEDRELLTYVEYAIDLTARHGQYIGKYDPERNDVTHFYPWPMCLEMFLFMDLDMFGFYDEDEFRANNKTVRDEYYKTSDSEYLAGRQNFLRMLLDKPRIMYVMNDEVESTVRANIQRSLDDPLY